MKPDFGSMTRKELLAYMLQHRNDDDAFYAFMDKVYTEPRKESYPPLTSVDDLEQFPEVLERFQAEQERLKES